MDYEIAHLRLLAKAVSSGDILTQEDIMFIENARMHEENLKIVLEQVDQAQTLQNKNL